MDVRLKWLAKFLGDLGGGAAGGLAIGALSTLIKTFFEKSGEKVFERFGEYATVRIFGIQKEDERRFNVALSGMAQNWADRLLQRLVPLGPKGNNDYRIMIMDDDPEVIRVTLQFHAEMDDPTWVAYLAVIRDDTAGLEGQFQRFMAWAWNNTTALAGWIANAAANFNETVTDDIYASGVIDVADTINDELDIHIGNEIRNLFA